MVITARVIFDENANRERLIQAFFQREEFSPKSRIQIYDDKTAFVELYFDEIPPQKTIKAISECKVESLVFGGLQLEAGESLQHKANESSQLDVNTSPQFDVDTVKAKPREEDYNSLSVCELEEKTFKNSNDADALNREHRVYEHQEELEDCSHKICKESNREEKLVDGSQNSELQSEPEDSAEQLMKESTQNTTKTDREEQIGENPKSESQNEPEDVAESLSEGKNEVAAINKSPKKKRRGRSKPSEDDYIDEPVFDEKAESSGNFWEFIKSVNEWLGLSIVESNYLHILIGMLSRLNQKPYELRYQQIKDANKALHVSDAKRAKISKNIASLMKKKGHDVAMLPYIITIMKYKDFFSANKQDVEQEISSEIISDIEPKNDVQSIEPVHQNSLLSNPEFASILERVDNSKPLEEQIRTLYTEMGFGKVYRNIFNKICNITISAIVMDSFESIDDVIISAGEGDPKSKDCMKLKFEFSELVNDFNKKFHIKRMKVVKFLKELKEIFSLN